MPRRAINKIIISGGTEKQKQLIEELGMKCELFECDAVPELEDKELKSEMLLQEIANYRGRLTAKQMVGRNHYDFVIIAVETGMIFRDKMLKKPKTRAQLIRILKSLSGNTHRVVTGLCVWWGQKGVTINDETYVKFRELSQEEIEWYADRVDPAQNGIYNLFGPAASFVESINGSITNLEGVPVNKMYEVLEDEFLFKLYAETDCGVWDEAEFLGG